ncbi:MAG: phage tail protein [Alphaproteobacteria bacterium]
MASIVLSAAGQAVLPGVGGTVLGALGRYGGGIVDQKLGLTGGRKLSGPRLENLKVQDSRYGAGIPVIYGRARVAGQVIWASDLIETAHEDHVGGKGGGGSASATRYAYSVHCAVAIGNGSLARLASVWADGKLIYDGTNWKSGLAGGTQFYPGHSTQNPDPVMESALGAGNVPAYRGIAYVVFENLQLADFGNRLPNLTFEIIANESSAAPAVGAHVDPGVMNDDFGIATPGGTPPLTVAGDSRRVSQVAVLGMENALAASAAAAFTAITYDVSGATPVEVARVSSADFTTDNALASIAWALAPDRRYAAVVAISNASPTALATLAIYDVLAGQWGPPLQLPVKNFARSVCWLDALRFVVADHDGSQLGVQIFARAGIGLVALGFHPVWGAGSAGNRFTLSTGQFIPIQGGILMLTGNAAFNPTALYACHLRWGNGLTVETPYTLSGSVPAGAGRQLDIIALGDGAYVVCFSLSDRVVMLSCVPTAAAAVITRSWQTIVFSAVSNYIAPCMLGGRLLFLLKSIFENRYRIGEVVLGTGTFTLVTDSMVVTGDDPAGGTHYAPWPIDGNRALIQSGTNFNLTFGEFRIFNRHAGGDNLQNIVGDILERAGYAAGDSALAALADISVTGYVAQPPMTGRSVLEPLRLYGLFDLIESNDQLVAVTRHDTVDAVIPDAELQAGKDPQKIPPPLVVRRAQELDLPREMTIDYIDPARDFEVGSARARRIAVPATARAKLALPVVCSADQAKRVAEGRLFAVWAERATCTFYLSRRYLPLNPGDVVTAGGRRLRLTAIQQSGAVLQCSAVDDYHAAHDSAAAGDAGVIPVAAGTAFASALYLMDLPPLTAEADQPGIYVAMSGAPGWRGGSLWRAADGVNYILLDNFSTPAVAGLALTALPGAAAEYWDRAGTVEVQLLQGSLASCTEAELLGGANAALLNGEIIQFQTATLLGPGYYRLSNLLRGRKGTEDGISTHVTGENFVVLSGATLRFLPLRADDRNRGYDYRAVSLGFSLGDVPDMPKVAQLRSLQPLAPAHLRGTRSAGVGSDLSLTWVRRARLDAEWTDYVDVPLDETAELYDLEIRDGLGAVVRSVSGLTTPAYIYTAAQQSADFTVIPTTYDVRVYQVSARYGRGSAAVAVL